MPKPAYNFHSLLLAGLLVCCFTGCSSSNNTISSLADTEKSEVDQAKKPVVVSIDETQKQEIGLQVSSARNDVIHVTVESPGQVQPNAELSALVTSPSSGKAMLVEARLGDTVQTGQLMAIIKSDPIAQVQSDLLQNVLQVKADMKQQEVGLKLDRITFDRESLLYKEQVSAKADLQTAENQLEKDEANLASLQAKMAAYIKVAQERLTGFGAPSDSARTVVAQNKINPEIIIRAPRSGVVVDRSINPGEITDGSKAIFTLADLSQVWLMANIFEKDVELVKQGQDATVTLDDVPDHHFPAKIAWISNSLNPTTRTLPVRANVPNPDSILRPNMFARIKIDVGDTPVLLIPRSAIIQKGDRTLVFIATGNDSYEERDVKTGASDVNDIEIKSGISVGQQVVSQGGTALLGTAMKTAEGRGD